MAALERTGCIEENGSGCGHGWNGGWLPGSAQADLCAFPQLGAGTDGPAVHGGQLGDQGRRGTPLPPLGSRIRERKRVENIREREDEMELRHGQRIASRSQARAWVHFWRALVVDKWEKLLGSPWLALLNGRKHTRNFVHRECICSRPPSARRASRRLTPHWRRRGHRGSACSCFCVLSQPAF
jgi:hypothetical protein